MDGMSLLDVLRGVMLDPAEQAAYSTDPAAYLERFGYDDVEPADLSEAFGLVADTLPPAQAQAAWAAAGTRHGGALDLDDDGADDGGDLDDGGGLDHGGGLGPDLDGDGDPDGGLLDDDASPFAHHGTFDHQDVFDHHDLGGDDDPGHHDAGAADGGGHHDLDDFDQLDGYGSLDDDGPDVGSF